MPFVHHLTWVRPGLPPFTTVPTILPFWVMRVRALPAVLPITIPLAGACTTTALPAYDHLPFWSAPCRWVYLPAVTTCADTPGRSLPFLPRRFIWRATVLPGTCRSLLGAWAVGYHPACRSACSYTRSTLPHLQWVQLRVTAPAPPAVTCTCTCRARWWVPACSGCIACHLWACGPPACRARFCRYLVTHLHRIHSTAIFLGDYLEFLPGTPDTCDAFHLFRTRFRLPLPLRVGHFYRSFSFLLPFTCHRSVLRLPLFSGVHHR